MFLLSDKKQMLQGAKESQRINYFTDIVYLKWALQPISSTYDDIYQEKFNTIFQTFIFTNQTFTEAFFAYPRDRSNGNLTIFWMFLLSLMPIMSIWGI